MSTAATLKSPAPKVIHGVVFDMDGTLTVPVLDFALMRKRLGITQGDILDTLNTWDAEKQAWGHKVIQEMEEQALHDMALMPGAVELCRFLDQRGLKRGLITRNVLRSVDFFHTHHFKAEALPLFSPAISRECAFMYKPSPEALLHCCETWGIAPHSCIMVGDSAKDDVACGRRAGALTVLLDWEGRAGHSLDSLEGEQRPDYLVQSLTELQQLLLSDEFELLPTPAP